MFNAQYLISFPSLLDVMYPACIILCGELPFDNHYSHILRSEENVRVNATLKSAASYIILQIICSFGKVIGILESVLGVDLFIPYKQLLHNDFLGV